MKNLLYLLFVLPLLFSCGGWGDLESPTSCHQCNKTINGAPYDSIKNPSDQNKYLYICSKWCMNDYTKAITPTFNELYNIASCPDCGGDYNKKTWGERCPKCIKKKRQKSLYKSTEHLRNP